MTRDASLSVYISSDDDDHPRGCDWRNGSCRNPAVVSVHLAEIDDGEGSDYCDPHARVMVNAAVTRLWQRFDRPADQPPKGASEDE